MKVEIPLRRRWLLFRSFGLDNVPDQHPLYGHIGKEVLLKELERFNNVAIGNYSSSLLVFVFFVFNILACSLCFWLVALCTIIGLSHDSTSSLILQIFLLAILSTSSLAVFLAAVSVALFFLERIYAAPNLHKALLDQTELAMSRNTASVKWSLKVGIKEGRAMLDAFGVDKTRHFSLVLVFDETSAPEIVEMNIADVVPSSIGDGKEFVEIDLDLGVSMADEPGGRELSEKRELPPVAGGSPTWIEKCAKFVVSLQKTQPIDMNNVEIIARNDTIRPRSGKGEISLAREKRMSSSANQVSNDEGTRVPDGPVIDKLWETDGQGRLFCCNCGTLVEKYGSQCVVCGAHRYK